MTSSWIRTVDDPDALAAALGPRKVEITVLDRGRFKSTVTRIELHRLWLQRAEESLARVSHLSPNPSRISFKFQAGQGSPVLVNGLEIGASRLFVEEAGRTYHHRHLSPTQWGSFSLPIDDAVEELGGIAGRCLAPARVGRPITPRPAALATLKRLHASAGYLAEHAPEVISNAEAARGLEQELILATANCLTSATDDAAAARRNCHETVIKRFRATMEANPDRALYVPELCKEIGVAERTLRACCQEYFGVGPKRYLLLRRMHMARRSLRRARSTATSVSDVATEHGFWELGRFAVEFRRLFGESPSVTLHRPPR